MEEDKNFRLLIKACERCENYATSHYYKCEDKSQSPVHELYLRAEGKREVIYVRDEWETPPIPPPGII